MDISQKSLGVLIDELITTDIRCWFAQEMVTNGETDEEVAKAGRLAQTMNARRNDLIGAINDRVGEAAFSPSQKTYS